VVFYKRLVETRNVEGVDELASEIEDRYGRLPREALQLLEFQKVRLLAVSAGMDRITVRKSLILFEVAKDRKLAMEAVERIGGTGAGFELMSGERPGIRLTEVPEPALERLALVRKVLNAASAV
jgi:transcription-repair coupling factor (superfamily II helicase)